MPFHLDDIQLKSFIAVAETGSFSQAGDIVGRSQSAVSIHIQKLEQGLRCELFDRKHKEIHLTEKGELFLAYARKIIELQWEAFSKINEPEVKGVIRLGAPDDFASHYLSEILANFSKYHPQVQLNIRCDLTLNLLSEYEAGNLDLVLIKRDAGTIKGGTVVWKEPLVWVCSEKHKPKEPVQLILSPAPCVYRSRALAALERLRKPCEVVYTSPCIDGRISAVKAGLGITVLPLNFIPKGLVPAHASFRLPPLQDCEIALLRSAKLPEAGTVLADHISHSLEKIPHY
ncbi:MAG: LysR family transcriptional regulator [Alphaproteobacteria bacterium]|jgi:DNA-binding transcriptional LysR family regulator|nr:LysR family transcriptional regulator [Alphaproteobacteria bacterium]|tara:strand:+ start:2833 stop:3693 length:861 start_codon:yes stop_codon:yes gene_type:complete